MVLASLEAQGLVHKARNHRPLATEEERDEVIRQATKETRRAERLAVKKKLPVPIPKEPATTIEEYGWRLGSDPRAIADGTAQEGWGQDEGRWLKAERMEEQFHRAKTREAEQIAERQRVRRAAFRQEKLRLKAEREEDSRLGRTEDVKREKRRLEALANIEKYSRATGEDVSDWYEELGQPLDEVQVPRESIDWAKGQATPGPRKRFGMR